MIKIVESLDSFSSDKIYDELNALLGYKDFTRFKNKKGGECPYCHDDIDRDYQCCIDDRYNDHHSLAFYRVRCKNCNVTGIELWEERWNKNFSDKKEKYWYSFFEDKE